ncbi:MAG: deoxyribose-phosphate aldolase [Zestosphaera tikiterensis]|uniref:Deoxyribose-phosphate aldolase n=1 Tax=Zestosphaera tikiterensis TaxID=1973259 RepID=A0A2R7Y6F0_9CREN|nr:MAG: deoxyribose-phosphate aldolase [Zestosphaera tikiterensis]
MLSLSHELINVLKTINLRIDQTMLKYDKSVEDYVSFAKESDKYGFRALVVPSSVVEFIAPEVKTPIASVVGFPHGYHPLRVKIDELKYVANAGAKEVDVVLNIVNLKSRMLSKVEEEVEELVHTARDLNLGIKVIVETSALTDEELVAICKILLKHKPDFIKTNTGFGARGVSVRDVLIIKKLVGNELKIKAAGGVRNAVEALTLVSYGADVIGTSSGVEIVKDASRILTMLQQ